VLWLSLYAQWMTVVPVIVPSQVTGVLGCGGAAKEGITGSIVALGAVVALVVAPLAGALSDRRRSPRGRRRPYLVSGTIGSCIALAFLPLFGPGSNLLLYALAIVHLQFWWNWASGPYAGLISDVVPREDQGTASGWMNAMSIIGTILGNVLIAVLYRPSRAWPIVAMFVALNLAALAATVRGVREPPARGAQLPFRLGPFLASFYVPPRAHANFYWVLITRLAANMGIWSVFTFLLFYLETVLTIGCGSATSLLAILLALGAAFAIPASLLGVWLSGRYGLVPIVRATSWIMTATTICYVLIAVRPQLALVVPVVVIFSAAYGAFGAVDWALALAVLPAGKDAGKDMGIWHVSLVLPQILGPVASGWLITWIAGAVSPRAAYEVAFGIAALWFAAAAALVGRVRLRPITRN